MGISAANVQATVIDISQDVPKKEDTFLVDTNVWVWQTYTRASLDPDGGPGYRIRKYPSYISKTLAARSNLTYTGLMFSELAHVIEAIERRIYSSEQQLSDVIRAKNYRALSQERVKVVSEIKAAWEQVTLFASCIPISVDDVTTSSALKRMEIQPLDGYDSFAMEAIRSAYPGTVNVITDDSDFIYIPDIQLFTANRNVLQAARQAGKLIVR